MPKIQSECNDSVQSLECYITNDSQTVCQSYVQVLLPFFKLFVGFYFYVPNCKGRTIKFQLCFQTAETPPFTMHAFSIIISG